MSAFNFSGSVAVLLLVPLLVLSSCGDSTVSGGTVTPVKPKCADQSTRIDFEIATFVTPRNFPDGLFSDSLMDEYYIRTSKIGCYVANLINWSDADNLELKSLNEKIVRDAKRRGFRVILQSNLLTSSADGVGTPGSISGNSFTDPVVRDAYKRHLLYLASLGPETLLTAVELNNLLLSGNQAEYDAFKQFSSELYSAIKAQSPNVNVSISFQWDIFYIQGNFTELQGFENSLDIYSFTSYPTLFGMATVSAIPGGARYYSAIRDYLPPNARVAISENGWSSADFSTEQEQAEFYRQLPDLYRGLSPEFVVISYLNDYPLPANPDPLVSKFSSMGLIDVSGKTKPAYGIVAGY